MQPSVASDFGDAKHTDLLIFQWNSNPRSSMNVTHDMPANADQNAANVSLPIPPRQIGNTSIAPIQAIREMDHPKMV